MNFKRFIITSLSACSLFTLYNSHAAYAPPHVPEPVSTNNWYVGLTGGATFTPDTKLASIKTAYNVGWDAGAEVGYRMDYLRYELEYLYQKEGIDKITGVNKPTGKLRLHTGLLNVMYDFGDEGGTYNPYIGVGIGYTTLNQTHRKSDNTFAYQAQIGMGFNVIDNAMLTLGYRYLGTGEAKKALGERYQSHLANLGLVYYLD